MQQNALIVNLGSNWQIYMWGQTSGSQTEVRLILKMIGHVVAGHGGHHGGGIGDSWLTIRGQSSTCSSPPHSSFWVGEAKFKIESESSFKCMVL